MDVYTADHTTARKTTGLGNQRTTALSGNFFQGGACQCQGPSSALGVLNDYALYKSTHSLTHSLASAFRLSLPIPLGVGLIFSP